MVLNRVLWLAGIMLETQILGSFEASLFAGDESMVLHW